MRLCVRLLAWISLVGCIVIDSDYNVAMDDEVTPSPTSSAKRKERNCTRDTAIIDKLLNGTGYNKFRIPKDDGVRVSVQFWVQAITSINEITNDFEMDIYINEMWMDPALNFANLNPCKHNLSLSHQVLDRLWTPNSCFVNSKFAEIHDSPFKNVFLMLYPNGTVWVNYRVNVKGPCAMSLELFPLDIQECFLIYESFNYNNQEVQMRWSNNPDAVIVMTPIMLPDFDLIKISPTLVNAPYPAGWWDELHVRLTFERRYIWYFMQAYLPTYLTIFISWISFCLGPRSLPARTMLGVNALLAMIFQFGNIMRNLPRVSYIKAIDVWMLMSMTFVFCSLLELAIVGYKVKNEDLLKKRGSVCTKKPPINNHVNHLETSPTRLCRYDQRLILPMERRGFLYSIMARIQHIRHLPPEKIDHASSFIFPACFALFNIIYWSFYYNKKLRHMAQLKL
ncbi:unnamed protein product [Cylicocyclus nassatus]|uniref:Uncharacterized protein n=1 Tax=Cylicocyclus nassatus TaxID=53992 RepID=A0AA36DMT3_CYLNA|nr:unnamed protein product [Cylicocyclus nassatus]